MARCPFAQWLPMPGYSGSYSSAPFKIVHHTTEGSSASGAFRAYRNNRSAPHFTVDEGTVYQHFDTSEFSRSLRNGAGGVQTNRDSAIQIEVVGFAHLPKDGRTLSNVARLCRWIEDEHNVAKDWPNGLPKTATPQGKDPGGHNRDAATWDTQSGHYGHCHVPENTHWDPAYTAEEVAVIMGDQGGFGVFALDSPPDPAALDQRPDFSDAQSTMADHADVGLGEIEDQSPE